jgi:hypothetical protein
MYARGSQSWVPLSADSSGRLHTVLASQAVALSSNTYGYNTATSAWVPLFMDNDTSSLVSIDEAHHQIHMGNMFTTDWYADGLTNTSSANLVLETGVKEAHSYYEVQAETETHFSIYEGVIYAASGTAIARLNKDRTSALTATVFAHHTPTTPNISAATLIRTRHFGSGNTPTGMSPTVPSLYEIILKPSTKYLFQIINQSGGTGWYAFYLNWYEIT